MTRAWRSLAWSYLAMPVLVVALHYDPTKCSNMHEGHCRDNKHGGAWAYTNTRGECNPRCSNESYPSPIGITEGLPQLFPEVASVADVGGGPGAYLLGFCKAGVQRLLTVEPHEISRCLCPCPAISQLRLNVFSTAAAAFTEKFDLVQSIEVAEHFPLADPGTRRTQG